MDCVRWLYYTLISALKLTCPVFLNCSPVGGRWSPSWILTRSSSTRQLDLMLKFPRQDTAASRWNQEGHAHLPPGQSPGEACFLSDYPSFLQTQKTSILLPGNKLQWFCGTSFNQTTSHSILCDLKSLCDWMLFASLFTLAGITYTVHDNGCFIWPTLISLYQDRHSK